MRSIGLRGIVLVFLLTSCAVTTPGIEPTPSMTAARAGLRPEYRIFYDTLSDYGQWVLIEPYGYAFRPELSFADWRPYSYGYWAPSDSYGWVWVSSEPYGWATYHYGRWLHDDFQGWVWIPGDEWGPSWVAWETTGNYIGWAPLAPGGGLSQPLANVPGGSYVFCSMDQMGSTNLEVKQASDLGDQVAQARPIERHVMVDGVRVPAGPSFNLVEKVSGRALVRVKTTDLLPNHREGPVSQKAQEAAAERPTREATQRAGEEAAREIKGTQTKGAPPPARVPLVRPLGPHVHPKSSAPDTSAADDGGHR